MAPVLRHSSLSPPKASSPSPKSLLNANQIPPSSRSSLPPLYQPTPFSHALGRGGLSSSAPSSPYSPRHFHTLHSQPTHPSYSDFPPISASRSLIHKPWISSASGAPAVSTLGDLYASLTPPSFLYDFVRSSFQAELPDSVDFDGVPQGELDVSVQLPGILVFEVLGSGLASPVQSPEGSLPCNPCPLDADGPETGAPPSVCSSPPRQSLHYPSSGLSAVPTASVNILAPSGEVQYCPGSQHAAPVIPRSSPAAGLPPGAAAGSHGVSWSNRTLLVVWLDCGSCDGMKPEDANPLGCGWGRELFGSINLN